MRKRILGLLAAAMMVGGGVSVPVAAHPGPHHGHNIRGLCRAYFAGSETGREQKRKAPPFQALEDAAGVDEDDTADERDEKVREFCNENGGFDTGQPGSGPGSGNGQGNQP